LTDILEYGQTNIIDGQTDKKADEQKKYITN